MTNKTYPKWISESEEYFKAKAFLENTDAKQNVTYKWVSDFAKYLSDYTSNGYKEIDEKAESIIKYLGGGLGLFSLGVLAKVDADNAFLALWTIPSVAFANLAILLAVLAKRPRHLSGPPSIEKAVEFADCYHESEAKAERAFLVQWNFLCELRKLAILKKADLVAWAYCWYFFAIAFLVLPVIAAIAKFYG